ncbi:hypothetical protein MAR_038590 [Mya arenaria]|uniref:Endonuclease/exonuclease/phosphatase domain-containing protein n=1 Tax=Mya arenaria TaxID=6604 RepID=A0ABY7FW13_MYAAR|nr:hypothetical protein MAR_038590 [Mya arenaria]
MEKNGAVKCDREVIREFIQEERDEEKEIEMKKLNVIIHSLPESKGTSVEDKKVDDKRKVLSILNDVLNLDVQTENIIRLGKNIENREKARPLRVSVENFEGKRKVLDAYRRLKNHEKYNSIFLTPDLTPKQRKQAFELREERRMRERNGESGLMIRNGRIVQKQERQQQHDHPYTTSGACGRGDRREPSSPSPSSRSENVRQLNTLLTQASALNYEHLVVLGDFNFPEIDWDSWTVNRNENHPSFSFIECLRDNFLTQHVNFYTRYRDGQDPSCLDLLLSDNLTQIEGMKINGKLGLSDHISFTFKLLCPV